MRPRNLTYNGETRTLREWAAHAGLSVYTLRYRLESGWSVGDALYAPLNPRGRPSNRTAETDAQLCMRLVRADFARLVKDIDRALTDFNHQLSVVSACDRGVGENIARDPKDRGHPSTQDIGK